MIISSHEQGQRRHLNNAVRLPTAERAQVTAALLASLDGEPDEDVDAAWASEIEQRASRVRSGTAQSRPWHEICDFDESGRRVPRIRDFNSVQSWKDAKQCLQLCDLLLGTWGPAHNQNAGVTITM